MCLLQWRFSLSQERQDDSSQKKLIHSIKTFYLDKPDLNRNKNFGEWYHLEDEWCLYSSTQWRQILRGKPWHGMTMTGWCWCWPVDDVGQQVVVPEPVLGVHLLVVHRQGPVQDAALLQGLCMNTFILCFHGLLLHFFILPWFFAVLRLGLSNLWK